MGTQDSIFDHLIQHLLRAKTLPMEKLTALNKKCKRLLLYSYRMLYDEHKQAHITKEFVFWGKQYKIHCLLLTGKSLYLLPLVIIPIAFFRHLSYTSSIL